MTITYASMSELTEALKRAAEAHHLVEVQRGADTNWPAWYARYMAMEQNPKPVIQAVPQADGDDGYEEWLEDERKRLALVRPLDAQGQAIADQRRAEQAGRSEDVPSFEKGYL